MPDPDSKVEDSGWQDKLRSDELRRFADGAAGRHSVLIEIATPRPQVEIGKVVRSGREQRVPIRVTGDAVAEDHGEAEARARMFLTGVLGQEPVWLTAARAFVADVTSAQLRTIGRSPVVVAVHPNRRLR